ncbi:DUF6361 family protein [Mesorhizobium sp.]|uniref:DUF6361 family protein n=1 Tax=Mesorhizobium sp. TaxID=1871066 RepID=UPI000FE4F62D|nr:DUF6361 family protein [Mesorhizobium sp.]RWN25276.1 MAG: hypothetical protein EOR95_29195 [Mesorhizobium sp.]
MDPEFGWSYLSANALARARAHLDDGSQGVRDEVGFLTLHQRYADRFFPGTSVLHTRARYTLFVPWQFEDQQGRPEADAKRALVQAELRLAGRLKEAGQGGVIGGQVHPKPADIPPSTIYWTALSAWGILRRDPLDRPPTRQKVRALLGPSRRTVDADNEPLMGFTAPFVTLPARPANWTANTPLTFDLTADEGSFLKERLSQVCSPPTSNILSLLARLTKDGIKPPSSLFTSQPIVRTRAGRDRGPLERAEAMSHLAAIGRAIYAALVEELRDRKDGKEDTPRIHRDDLLRILQEHSEPALALGRHVINLVEDDIGSLPAALRDVLVTTLAWLDAGKRQPDNLLEVYAMAEGRKRGRARLPQTGDGRNRRLEWRSQDHPLAEPLHYRWDRVRRLLDDIRTSQA